VINPINNTSGEYKNYTITKRIENAEAANNKLSEDNVELKDKLFRAQEEITSIKLLAKEEKEKLEIAHERCHRLAAELNTMKNKVALWKLKAKKLSVKIKSKAKE
jgi:chromosome segregation ATPase